MHKHETEFAKKKSANFFSSLLQLLGERELLTATKQPAQKSE